jgi:hypothetical protein
LRGGKPDLAGICTEEDAATPKSPGPARLDPHKTRLRHVTMD